LAVAFTLRCSDMISKNACVFISPCAVTNHVAALAFDA
jgi:hypothetical protein